MGIYTNYIPKNGLYILDSNQKLFDSSLVTFLRVYTKEECVWGPLYM